MPCAGDTLARAASSRATRAAAASTTSTPTSTASERTIEMAAATTVAAATAAAAAAAATDDDASQGGAGGAAEEGRLAVDDGYGSGDDDSEHHLGLLLGDADRSNCTPQTTEASARARLRPHKPLPLAVLIGAAAFGLSMDQVSVRYRQPTTNYRRLPASSTVWHQLPTAVQYCLASERPHYSPPPPPPPPPPRLQNLMAPNLTAIAHEFGLSDAERDAKLGGEIAFAFFLLGAPGTFPQHYPYPYPYPHPYSRSSMVTLTSSHLGAPASLTIGILADRCNRRDLLSATVLFGSLATMGSSLAQVCAYCKAHRPTTPNHYHPTHTIQNCLLWRRTSTPSFGPGPSPVWRWVASCL